MRNRGKKYCPIDNTTTVPTMDECVCILARWTPKVSEVLRADGASTVCTGAMCFETMHDAGFGALPPSEGVDLVLPALTLATFAMALIRWRLDGFARSLVVA